MSGIIIRCWGGSQGLSSTYERAHVDERPFDPGINIIVKAEGGGADDIRFSLYI